LAEEARSLREKEAKPVNFAPALLAEARSQRFYKLRCFLCFELAKPVDQRVYGDSSHRESVCQDYNRDYETALGIC
jgi:hypothetical protein